MEASFTPDMAHIVGHTTPARPLRHKVSITGAFPTLRERDAVEKAPNTRQEALQWVSMTPSDGLSPTVAFTVRR
jgi:hypothetical protein